MTNSRLYRTESVAGDVSFTLRVPASKADAVEAHLASLLAVMGLGTEEVRRPDPPGVVLKRLRLEAGLSQKALADWVGTHQSRISDWESGSRAMPEEAAGILAERFGVPLSALLGAGR